MDSRTRVFKTLPLIGLKYINLKNLGGDQQATFRDGGDGQHVAGVPTALQGHEQRF